MSVHMIECSLPVEYCEYYPNNSKCKEWLERNLPEVFDKMFRTSKDCKQLSFVLSFNRHFFVTQLATETSGQSAAKEGSDEKGDNGADNETNDPLVGEKRGRQKRGGKALVKTKKKDDVERYVKLARSNRGKKKYVTGM